jgi:hypothetical protein
MFSIHAIRDPDDVPLVHAAKDPPPLCILCPYSFRPLPHPPLWIQLLNLLVTITYFS